MATQPASQAPASTTEPKVELTINAKPTDQNDPEGTPKPSLDRKDTIESFYSEEEFYIDPQPNRSRPRRRTPIHRHPASPIRDIYPRPVPAEIPMLSSSSFLINKVGNYDGIADIPFPGRSSVYLTTFPFSNRDVQKWSWLLNLGVEEKYVYERDGHGRPDPHMMNDEWAPESRVTVYDTVPGRGRARSPYYDPMVPGIPSIFLSKALDRDVIPEGTEGVRYVIVVQGRARGDKAAKLLVAESRKAAGIMMYYEALSGTSIVFVGAMKGGVGRKAVRKYKKVEKLDEMSSQGEDVVGIIC